MPPRAPSRQALAGRSTAAWLEGAERTLRMGSGGSVGRAFIRNLVLIGAILGIVGLMTPSRALQQAPGQALRVAEEVDWHDPVSPRNIGPSRIHMLTVRNVQVPLLLAWLKNLDTKPRSGGVVAYDNPDRWSDDWAATYAAMNGQNAAGIDDSVRFEGFTVGTRIPGTPIGDAGIPFDARITGIDGTPFESLEQAYSAVAERALRSERFTLTGELRGRPARWDLRSPSTRRTGIELLAGLDAAFNVEPRAFSLHGGRTWHGDSSTLALALAVYERYELERPLKVDIAATGFTNFDGSVQPVEGVPQKVVAAYRRGIRVVIVPYEEREAARKAGSKLGVRVIPVRTVDEAVAAMKSLT